MPYPRAILLLALVGCGGDSSVVERPDQPPVVNFEQSDEEMAAAIRQARGSIQGFIDQLPALRAEGAYFSVKVPIQVGLNTEHVWIDSPQYANGAFHGKLGNEPLEGPFKLGDLMSTPVAELSDWIAVRGGECFGGFTIVVVRSRLSPEQRLAFDQNAGILVPAVARPF
jgi:uncharacterized protein YegJ (DUF2314 family)